VPRPYLALVALAACGGDAAPVCDGELLFGRPNQQTGLTDDQCGPRCTCRGEVFEAPLYGDADADALLAWQLAEPYAELAEDPYDQPAPEEPPPGTVCAVTLRGDGTYTLDTFAAEEDAATSGAIVTHFGACGLCSPLADLAVYMRYPDLTEPVRACGLDSSNEPEHRACLEALGFTPPCAQIWYFNTLHTRDFCILECVAAIDAPYHQPDGTLNDCLICDEVQSGPVFKAVAGRTRRNTGIASAMCRPCREVQPLLHVYD
jgi:hypothetical protein